MKRTLTTISYMLMLSAVLFAASVAYAASTELEIRASTATDGTVTAEVVLDGTLNASGVQFALDYDQSKLSLSSCADGNLHGSYLINDTQPGSVRLVWYSTNGESVNGETSILKMTFSPIASGSAALTFSDSMSAMVVDSNLSTVSTNFKSASVDVTSGTTAQSAGAYTAPSASTAPPPVFETVATPTPLPLLTATSSPTPAPKQGASPVPSAAIATAVPAVSETIAPNAPGGAAAPTATAVTEAFAPVAVSPTAAPVANALKPASTDAAPDIEVIGGKKRSDNTAYLLILGGLLVACGVGLYCYHRSKNN